MSRWIDADAFKSWIDEYVSVFKKSDKAEIKGYISHQPSIDICLCRECKYTEFCEKKIHRHGIAYSIDFCSHGEPFGKTEQLK